MTNEQKTKKRQRRKDARPEEIIAAALKEFSEKGYAGASIGSIAARANIARSTVYLYFPDKEAVIRQAFEERIGSIFDQASSGAVPLDVPFETAFRGLLSMIYGRIANSEDIALLKVLVVEGAQFPELTRFYHGSILKRAEHMLKTVLKVAVERGEVRPEILNYDPKLIIAPAIIAGFWQLTFSDLEPLDIPNFIEGHIDIITRGLLSPPGNHEL